MNGIRILFLLFGAAGLLLFLLPVFAANPVINIGNITGITVAAGLLAAGLFYGDLCTLLREMRMTFSGHILFWILAVIFAVIVLLAAVTGCCIVFFPRGIKVSGRKARRTDKGLPVLIILGCQVRGTTPSRTLKDRTDRACTYLKEHPESICICSGGMGPGEDITEAACMRERLLAAGIKTDRILTESRSVSTYENMKFSLEILQEKGICGPCGIVTNYYHEYRALCMARKLGLEAEAVPVASSPIQYPTFFVREQYAILYMWLRALLR